MNPNNTLTPATPAMCDATGRIAASAPAAPASLLTPATLDIISRIARRYDLPAKCPITRDDLIQEACLALLERAAADSNFALALSEAAGMENHPVNGSKRVGAEGGKGASFARKAMQKAISRYVSPVTRSLDEVLFSDDNGDPVTLGDTLADTIAVSAADTAAATAEAGAFLSDLDALLAAGTITPAAYRKKKQRFLQKIRLKVSQNGL